MNSALDRTLVPWDEEPYDPLIPGKHERIGKKQHLQGRGGDVEGEP